MHIKGSLRSLRPILCQVLEFPHQIHLFALTELLTLTVTKTKNRSKDSNIKKTYQKNYKNCITFSRAIFIFSIRSTSEATQSWGPDLQVNKVNTILVYSQVSRNQTEHQIHWVTFLL